MRKAGADRAWEHAKGGDGRAGEDTGGPQAHLETVPVVDQHLPPRRGRRSAQRGVHAAHLLHPPGTHLQPRLLDAQDALLERLARPEREHAVRDPAEEAPDLSLRRRRAVGAVLRGRAEGTHTRPQGRERASGAKQGVWAESRERWGTLSSGTLITCGSRGPAHIIGIRKASIAPPSRGRTIVQDVLLAALLPSAGICGRAEGGTGRSRIAESGSLLRETRNRLPGSGAPQTTHAIRTMYIVPFACGNSTFKTGTRS